MMPSSPQSRTIGTGEWSSMPTVVFRLAGHDSIGPSDSDQSWRAISFAVVPPPARNALWLPQITSKYTSPHARWLPSSRNQNSGKTRRFRKRWALKKGMLWTDQMGSKVKCGMFCAFNRRWPRVLKRARSGNPPSSRSPQTRQVAGAALSSPAGNPCLRYSAEPPFTTDW